MNELHEILCPNFIHCEICQRIRENHKLSQIEKFTGNLDLSEIQNKHFYILEVSHQPTRETYFRFTLNHLKKAGRDLINGLSSISGISNRTWWKMFVESGIKYYSINHVNKEEFPIFKLNFLLYSKKDNLDSRMQSQLKFRLKKIHKDLNFKFKYIGEHNINKIMKAVDVNVEINYEAASIKKLDSDLINEINKLKYERPSIFGRQYIKNKQLQLA